MTLTLAVEFDHEAGARSALHALHRPALTVDALDLWPTDAVATVSADTEGPLQDALAALAACPGVRLAFADTA